MAFARFFEPTNMLAYDWKYGFPADPKKFNNSTIFESPETGDTVVYRGSFSFQTATDSDNNVYILGVTAGNLAGYEFYDDQILRVQMTGLRYDALSAFVYMQLGDTDPLYNLELMQEMFATNDTITGSAFSDTLAGFEGSDIVSGGRRHDTLYGNEANDTLNGNNGHDILVGGAGADQLTGEAGNDTFRYNIVSEGGDTITDFSNAVGNNDGFEFSVMGFGSDLVAGPLAAAQFQSTNSSAAANANVRFIYDADDFRLFFDADGNGDQSRVLIATLQTGAVVTAGDILLV